MGREEAMNPRKTKAVGNVGSTLDLLSIKRKT